MYGPLEISVLNVGAQVSMHMFLDTFSIHNRFLSQPVLSWQVERMAEIKADRARQCCICL